ncbi:papain-like cysteine protease family protein [Kitasatospora sp. NPDC093550]|uniref:papain-like cysteine protease family protein n=1 Tax=Kitasatospora sp. NPDC093550 TaxID=3364089 RepID=UPI0037FC2E5D
MLTFAAAAPAAAQPRTLGIEMQVQEHDQWCWAASGNTIAAWYGYSYTQNQFCNMAFRQPLTADCPNRQANLGNVQTALNTIGLNPGRRVDGQLPYETLAQEVDANRPVETRIQWAAGGGHMQLLYGYDREKNWVYWADPWPTAPYRYNWQPYDYYRSNDDFRWTESLYRIGA